MEFAVALDSSPSASAIASHPPQHVCSCLPLSRSSNQSSHIRRRRCRRSRALLTSGRLFPAHPPAARRRTLLLPLRRMTSHITTDRPSKCLPHGLPLVGPEAPHGADNLPRGVFHVAEQIGRPGVVQLGAAKDEAGRRWGVGMHRGGHGCSFVRGAIDPLGFGGGGVNGCGGGGRRRQRYLLEDSVYPFC